jgi:hypothetical protein
LIRGPSRDSLAGSNTSNNGGDQYVGLDRFGRVVDQWWATYNTGTGAVTGTVDRFQYGYDRDGKTTGPRSFVAFAGRAAGESEAGQRAFEERVADLRRVPPRQ